MAEETIVAVFDTAAHADAAVQELRAANVPASAISQHSDPAATSTTSAAGTTAPVREQGFWKSLFGTETDYEGDTAVYDRSLSGGSTVVTVKAPEEHVASVMDILERHSPVDIDDRAASYGVADRGVVGQTGAAAAPTPVATGNAAAPRATATDPAVTAKEGGTIQLAEETLSVGKRAVNRGTTRVRRYVVETPVHEQVSLRDETVSVERRPVADGRPVTGADFTDKVVELKETKEEAVVSKTARVREEVVIRKDATERTETVSDTVRRQEVEITNEPGVERTKTGTAPVGPANRKL
jgi:uncharacterized protein (TIGR02271 family)